MGGGRGQRLPDELARRAAGTIADSGSRALKAEVEHARALAGLAYAAGSLGLQFQFDAPIGMSRRLPDGTVHPIVVDALIADGDSEYTLNSMVDIGWPHTEELVRVLRLLCGQARAGLWLIVASERDQTAREAFLVDLSRTVLQYAADDLLLCSSLTVVCIDPATASVSSCRLPFDSKAARSRSLRNLRSQQGWVDIGEAGAAGRGELSVSRTDECIAGNPRTLEQMLIFSSAILEKSPRLGQKTHLLLRRTRKGFRLTDYSGPEVVETGSVGPVTDWDELWNRFDITAYVLSPLDRDAELYNHRYWRSRILDLNERLLP